MEGIFSLLDSYLDSAQSLIIAHLVLAPLLILGIEEMGVPTLIPGDAVLGYVGYGLSHTPTVTFFEAFMLGIVAVLGGSSILFFVARRWGRVIITKIGRYMFIEEKHIEKAERLFAKYGIFTIIIGRHIPGMRPAITIFAATSGMRYRTFIVSVLASSSIWIVLYLYLGKRIGANLQMLFRQYAGWSLVVILSISALLIGLHYYGVYTNRKNQ